MDRVNQALFYLFALVVILTPHSNAVAPGGGERDTPLVYKLLDLMVGYIELQ